MAPARKLSSVFIHLPEDCLHVLVKHPGTFQQAFRTALEVIYTVDPTQPVLLNCFVLDDKPNQTFTVEIVKAKSVSILKDLIKERKAPRLDHVAASDLDISQVSLPMNGDAEERMSPLNR